MGRMKHLLISNHALCACTQTQSENNVLSSEWTKGQTALYTHYTYPKVHITKEIMLQFERGGGRESPCSSTVPSLVFRYGTVDQWSARPLCSPPITASFWRRHSLHSTCRPTCTMKEKMHKNQNIVCVCVCVCVDIYIYICIYVCVCVYIYKNCSQDVTSFSHPYWSHFRHH